MNGDEDQARLIAERIARRVTGGAGSAEPFRRQGGNEIRSELSAMRASLDNLRQKLVQLESRLSEDEGASVSYSNSLNPQGGLNWATIGSAKSGVNPSNYAGTYAPAAHPSQERFGVEEATISELVDFFESDKKCEIEPGGKPCDHCAMCSSRGF